MREAGHNPGGGASKHSHTGEQTMNAKQSIYANLPKIVKFLGIEDRGEGARCPHCGAEGRFVYTFECADGTRRGAMKACYSKFPKTSGSPAPKGKAKKNFDPNKTWTQNVASAIESAHADNVFNVGEADILATIKRFDAGEVTESDVWNLAMWRYQWCSYIQTLIPHNPPQA